jgi:thymidylate synthase (FAD)
MSIGPYRSEKFPKMEVSLYYAPCDPEHLIAMDYLECIEDRKIQNVYDIEDNEAKKIAKWVLEGGHTPALESIYLSFLIRGISKVTSHQLVRHRIGVSIGQRTQRANSKEYLGNIRNGNHFIIPPSIADIMKNSPMIRNNIDNFMLSAQSLYQDFLEAGISEDDARYFIPQNSETSMTFKVIYKSLLDSICSTRLCALMQNETVEVVRLMAQAVREWNPFLGSYLKPICEKFGKCNRNENNPTDEFPNGVCSKTINGEIPVRGRNDTFDLTKYSKDIDQK